MSQTAKVETELWRTQERVRTLEEDFAADLSTANRELTNVKIGSEQTQVSLANSDAVVQEIIDQNLSLRGNLESMQVRVADLEEGEERVQENLAFQIQEFERRLSNLEAMVADYSSGSGGGAMVASAKPAPALVLSGPLAEADAALKAGKPKDALKALKGYKPTSDAEKEAARLFYAEALYKDRQLEDASTAYQRFMSTYPDSARMPEAMLQLGTILVELGAPDDAEFFLSELIRIYPDSAEAAKAKARINAM